MAKKTPAPPKEQVPLKEVCPLCGALVYRLFREPWRRRAIEKMHTQSVPRHALDEFGEEEERRETWTRNTKIQ